MNIFHLKMTIIALRLLISETTACKDGLYGAKCGQKCPKCKTCDMKTGECTSCPNGFYTKNCTKPCINPCATCKIHGECTSCKKSFILYNNEFCTCPNNTYAVNKTICKNCPANCKENDCDQTGACYSCKRGNWGSMCENKCVVNCELCDNGIKCKQCKEGYFPSGNKRKFSQSYCSSNTLRVAITVMWIILLVIIICSVIARATYYLFCKKPESRQEEFRQTANVTPHPEYQMVPGMTGNMNYPYQAPHQGHYYGNQYGTQSGTPMYPMYGMPMPGAPQQPYLPHNQQNPNRFEDASAPPQQDANTTTVGAQPGAQYYNFVGRQYSTVVGTQAPDASTTA